MADERDPQKLADELDRDRADMDDQSERLENEIQKVREEWHRRQKDPGVPGAEPRKEDRETGPSETQEEPGGPSG
jgi:hypothetical protein